MTDVVDMAGRMTGTGGTGGQPDHSAEPIAGCATAAGSARLAVALARRRLQVLPLLYRFRTIDRLPETPSRVAVRGTMVHSVLEQLFDLPRAERTVSAARRLLPEVWRELAAADPEIAALFGADEGVDLGEWLESASQLARQLLRARGSVPVRTGGP